MGWLFWKIHELWDISVKRSLFDQLIIEMGEAFIFPAQLNSKEKKTVSKF